jgi:predicted 3-demethylubiquinone-9 3-methyltransferase (glyoxalase superfamily)
MTSAQKITPCLWFDLEAEQRALCIGVHECPRSLDYTLRRGRAGPVGAVMTILFEIEGQQFLSPTAGRNSASIWRFR